MSLTCWVPHTETHRALVRLLSANSSSSLRYCLVFNCLCALGILVEPEFKKRSYPTERYQRFKCLLGIILKEVVLLVLINHPKALCPVSGREFLKARWCHQFLCKLCVLLLDTPAPTGPIPIFF